MYSLEPSSFRDPSGFLFYRDDVLYRQINQSYKDDYDHLMTSGLYEELVNSKLLIPHQPSDDTTFYSDDAYKIIRPEPIPFLSYPYEWSFSQLKQAALTTLEIQKIAMDFGMTLKDCSAYNIQFNDCKPVLIDTLSFERYYVGNIWKAYQQFLLPLSCTSGIDGPQGYTAKPAIQKLHRRHST